MSVTSVLIAVHTPRAPRPTTPTTDDDKRDNDLALVELGTYRDFLLLKKPLGIENNGVRHKGGSVLRETDDPVYNCLVSWIGGAVNTKDCEAAAF